MSAQTKGLAALLAAQGRNGDDELIHVNKRELAALERLGRRHGIETTINPNTGLREAFNWGSTLGGIAGGIAGTFLTAPTFGVINPYTGAALGSAAGTKLSGGSNEEALMNGAIAGVTAWGLGGAGDALGQLGQEAGKETIKAGVQTGTQELAKTGTEELAKTGIQEGTGQGIQQLVQQAPQNSAILQKLTEQGGEKLVGEGMSPQVGSVVGDKFVQTPLVEAPKMSVAGDSGVLPFGERASDYFSNVSKGIQSLDTPGKLGEFAVQNKGSLLAGGLGAYAMATDAAAQPEDTTATGDSYTGPSYRGEVYYTPYGERRTRAVPMAGGGISHFEKGGRSDLDVSDLESPAAKYLRRAEAAGMPIVDKGVKGGAGRVGYNIPVGDTDNLNIGVSGMGVRTDFPGSSPVTRGRVTGADLTYGNQDRAISARYEAMAPAVTPSNFGPMDAQAMMAMGPAPMARDRFSVNYRQSFANGGISTLGAYSDGGQLLRGPGDGVSDSIPATIADRQPARLAEGEFVVPARAVSELGNGSTEAGSKQLYAMLDRIAKKRKKGKGLAYNANPKKLLPA